MISKNIVNILILLIYISCSGTRLENDISLKDKFSSGMTNLENEKFLNAQSDFKYVVSRGTGTELGDDAQYYLGESYFRNKEYLLAVAEYEKLTRRMGFSPFVEDARFKICESYKIESPKYYHDQDYTEKAIQRFQEFLDDFPKSTLKNEAMMSIELLRNKLAKKLYETGILYIKLDEHESAKLSFQLVIDEYYDTDIFHHAQQGIIVALANNKELINAENLLKQNEQVLKENNLYEKAMDSIEKAKKQVTAKQ